MLMAKFDIEKFNGKNDFALWRMKMRAMLVHQGLEEALEGERKFPSTLSEKKKEGPFEQGSQCHNTMLGS